MNPLFKKQKYNIYAILFIIVNLISFNYSKSANNLIVSIHRLAYAYFIEFTKQLDSISLTIVFVFILALIYYLIVKLVKNNILKWCLIIISILLSIPILDLVGSGSNSL